MRVHRVSLLKALAVASTLFAAEGVAQFSSAPGRPGERSMPAGDARLAIVACGNPSLQDVDVLSSQDVERLAWALTDPNWNDVCVHRNAEAALALLEAYVGDPVRLDTGTTALQRLWGHYRERAEPQSRPRLNQLVRALWLRGRYSSRGDDPYLTLAEQDRILSDPAIVSFLRSRAALVSADPTPRRLLVRAQLIESSPHFDPVGAASLLEPDDPTSLRLRPILALVDRGRAALAIEQLRGIRLLTHDLDAEGREEVAAIIARATGLLAAPDAAARETGARLLAALAENGVGEARTVLLGAIQPVTGMVELGAFPDDVDVHSFDVVGDDYPRPALRNEEGGIVRLHALFGPDGRLLLVDAGPGETTVLARAAARLWSGRSLRRLELRGYRGRFVRVAGPVVEFRMPDCNQDPALPLPPPQRDRITIDGHCIRFPGMVTIVD